MKSLFSTAALCAGALMLAATPAAAQFGPAPNIKPIIDAAAAKPTPKSPWGPPDLTDAWDRPGGIALPPASDAEKNADVICVVGCPPPGVKMVDILATMMGPTSVQGLNYNKPDRPKYRPELVKKVIQLETDQVKLDPVLKCANPGLPRIGPPEKIIQSKNQVVFLYNNLAGSFWRIIPTDGRPIDPEAERNPLGASSGRWEGDTLVIVTERMTDDTWLFDDGAFHTEKLKVTERLTRVGDSVRYVVTSEDPDVLTEPWTREIMLVKTDVEPLQPVPCMDQTVDLIVDGAHHPNTR